MAVSLASDRTTVRRGEACRPRVREFGLGHLMAEVFFFIAAFGAVAGAVGVVVLRNPFYSVLALVSHLLSLAMLFLLLRAEFVAAAQVIVYAGAVMVLYVFVVAYVGAAEPAQLRAPVSAGQRSVALLFAGALAAELFIAVLGSGLKGIDSEGASYRVGFGTPAQIGELLLTRFLLPFEVASFLLLIAAVGAVVLARRRGGIHEEEERVTEVSLARPLGTGTMAEAAGGLTGTPVHRSLGPPSDEGVEREPAEAEPAGRRGGGW
jgi:NADH-quinone oxidoreductase subunit J